MQSDRQKIDEILKQESFAKRLRYICFIRHINFNQTKHVNYIIFLQHTNMVFVSSISQPEFSHKRSHTQWQRILLIAARTDSLKYYQVCTFVLTDSLLESNTFCYTEQNYKVLWCTFGKLACLTPVCSLFLSILYTVLTTLYIQAISCHLFILRIY